MVETAIERPRPITLTLYDADVTIIDAADTNDAGRSATARRIIREWNALQGRGRVMIDTRARYDAECADG